MNAARGDCDHTGAKVSRTRDVIWSIADHDELFGRKPGSEMFINSLRSQRRQVAAIERFITERARQLEEFSQSRDFNF